MADLAERFDALVDRSGTHHCWLGATDQHGIPQMRVDGRLTTARRVAWQLHHGPLPPGARLQGCPADPRCVRVAHLTVTEPRASPPTPRIRRPRGQGSMREIRPGVWKLTVTTDSHRRVSRTVRADRATAHTELARLAAHHGHRPAILDALVAIHLAQLADTGRSPSTLRRYRQLWRTWLSPALGATHPNNLHRHDIERALTAMADAGQSPRSIHQAAVILNTTFSWARTRGIAPANPVLDCQLPDGTALTSSRRR